LKSEVVEVLTPLCELLIGLVNHRDLCKEIRSIDSFSGIIALLKRNDHVASLTSKCVLNIIFEKENIPILLKSQVIEFLVDILRTTSEVEFLQNTLMILQFICEYLLKKDKLGLKDLIAMLKDPTNISTLSAIKNLCPRLEKDLLLATGIDDYLIKTLFEDSQDVTVRCLQTIASVSEKIGIEFALDGKMGLPRCMILMKSSSETIRLHTLLLLTKLSTHVQIRNQIRILDGIPIIVSMLDTKDETMLEKVCSCLANLSYSNSMNQVIIRNCDGIAPLLELIYHTNAQVQKAAANALSNLLNDSKNKSFVNSIAPNSLTHIIALKNGASVQSQAVVLPRKSERKDDEEKDNSLERKGTLFSSFFKRN